MPLQPTQLEQYLLELINRARANPAAEAAKFGIDLNEGLPAGTITATPKQPVAFNFYLVDSARDHSQWLLDNGSFQHDGPGGNHPSDRARNAGYTLTPPWGVGENLAWQGTTSRIPDPYSTTTALHEGLFVDEGIDDRGHRTNMLAENHKEIGVGIVAGRFTLYNAVMITTDFAYTAGNAFLTGVVFQDDDHNQFYSPTGEGYADVTVRATSTTTGAMYETTTFSTGGYTLQVPPGTYNVMIGGGDLLDTTFLDVEVGSQNVKIDAIDSIALRPWSNPNNQFDADGSGDLEPHDVLVLIDELNRSGSRSLVEPPTTPLSGLLSSVYLDVNRDAHFTPGDILRVIDAINRLPETSLLTGNSSGGLLSFVETSESFAIPEPSAATLALLSIAGLLMFRRRHVKLAR